MRYQVMELEVPSASHGNTGDDRFVEVPGRIVSVLSDCGGQRKRTLLVLVELDGEG